MSNGPPVRVALATGLPVLDAGIAAHAAAMNDLVVVGTVTALKDLDDLAGGTHADVAVIGIGPSDSSIATPAGLARAVYPSSIRLIGVTLDDDLDLIVDFLEIGGSGCISVRSPLCEVSRAVRAVHDGQAWLSRTVALDVVRRLVDRRVETVEISNRLARLSARERTVLDLIGCDASYRMIAEALGISPNTARTHVTRVLHKLEVSSRLEASLLAFRFSSANADLAAVEMRS